MVHTAVAATGLTANSTDLTAGDLGFVFQLTRGFYDGLEARGTDTVIPSAAGQVARNRLADRRYIDAEGFVRGLGSTEADARGDMADRLAVLEALMRPDQDPYVLEFTDLDGVAWTINARPLGWDPVVPGPVPTFQRGVLHWLSVDPDWVEAPS